MKRLQKGFTLIELLVVIAIIGILSSIVLASLSSARSKGEDAAITSTLANMRAQAELFYSNNNTYSVTPATICTTAGSIFTSTATGGLSALTTALLARAPTAACTSSSTAWAAEAPLKSGGHACADSSGNSISSSTKTAAYVISTGVCN